MKKLSFVDIRRELIKSGNLSGIVVCDPRVKPKRPKTVSQLNAILFRRGLVKTA